MKYQTKTLASLAIALLFIGTGNSDPLFANRIMTDHQSCDSCNVNLIEIHDFVVELSESNRVSISWNIHTDLSGFEIQVEKISISEGASSIVSIEGKPGNSNYTVVDLPSTQEYCTYKLVVLDHHKQTYTTAVRQIAPAAESSASRRIYRNPYEGSIALERSGTGTKQMSPFSIRVLRSRTNQREADQLISFSTFYRKYRKIGKGLLVI